MQTIWLLCVSPIDVKSAIKILYYLLFFPSEIFLVLKMVT